MKCNTCPRHCNIDRKTHRGFCNADEDVTLALCNLHFSEEPCISGTNGSGTIFFSGCNLRCVFCQNLEVSRNKIGTTVSINRLAEIFKELEIKGANNINLVTPTHYALQIIEALKVYKPQIPIVYNTNGYEDVDTLIKLKDYIDIYLTDFKYYDDDLAMRLSSVKNYKNVATAALRQMLINQPKNIYDKNGIMQKGVIVRHLVLPSYTDDSIKVLKHLYDNFSNNILISLMSQYTPLNIDDTYSDISRRLKPIEYKRVLMYLNTLGFDGFKQELDSANSTYIPNFDLTGVKKK